MRKSVYISLSFMLLLLFNCKSVKSIKPGEENLKLSTKQLIKVNNDQEAQFKTLQSKLRIGFTQQGKSQTYTVTLRAKKDEVIWINAPFSVIRAMITPDRLSFYNKLDNTYFDGDYQYISKLLGTDFDFQKVQNLLFGETIFDLTTNDYTASVADGAYVVQPKQQQALFEIFFLLSPKTFKVTSQQISQPSEFRHLQVDYEAYQLVENQNLPQRIKVMAVEANEETIIDLEFKNVTLNEDFRFPFKIPSGFKKIEL
ncbi:DUF4292 domain-containing protein [Tamlana sp. s12]|uniref:DUF4292 domain-containing protein n=1 Tax=Tamlana sp. s12 TaxID=1630406 RepID=UPI0007FF034F|nr:DUF4292 domain-containing protein [Tamlana sp. s12]OBQ54969.1 deoxyuridine 5'-triphosphate nucleotidohydrolase [Tamlana sp. s12]QQY83077.1 DUF4292 domain-containing protein [Tamlana sp. s12]